MSAPVFMFYFFELAAASSALAMVFARNVFYGALLLIVCLLSLAGIYVLAFADFIAVTQILVYAGGILVIIIFGIMLTTNISGKSLVVEHAYTFAGGAVGTSLLFILIFFLSKEYPLWSPAGQPAPFDSIKRVGIALMSDFVLPFEIAGILLLVSLVGAATTASTMKSNQKH